jgi:para-nitrobenzyl esterase
MGARLATTLLAATFAVVLAGCGGSDSPPTERSTAFGTVEGIDDSGGSGTYQWKGVPYAKPPVGALRWRAPVDPDPWTTPKATTAYGHACAQYGRIYGPGTNNTYDATIGTTLNQAVGDEDCL